MGLNKDNVSWDDFLEFGTSRYPLLRRLKGSFRRLADSDGSGKNIWTLAVAPIFPPLAGMGETRTKAEQDFKAQFHSTFQFLYGKPEFRMDDHEKATWALLSSVVDVPAYSRHRILSFREIGEVLPIPGTKTGLDHRIKVKWIDGRAEFFPLEKAAANMAGLRPGDWFEAIVLRSAGTGVLLEVAHCQWTAPIKPMTLEEAVKHWDNIPVWKGPALEPQKEAV